MYLVYIYIQREIEFGQPLHVAVSIGVVVSCRGQRWNVGSKFSDLRLALGI